MKTALVVAAILALGAPLAALAQVGNAAMPIVLKMKRGTDHLSVHGALTRNGACCTYVFKAAAGQKLYWTLKGPATRVGLTYPDGDGINPGLPSPADLPQTGDYTLILSPDLMADGAFGRFTLTIRIPPPTKGRHR
jgi:hypothetical protein